jgi:hypothetical protein
MTTPTSPPFAHPAKTWNDRFSKDGYVFDTESNEWLRRHATVWKGGSKSLCVADGEGRNSIWLAKDDFLADKRTQQAVIMILIIGEVTTKVMDGYAEFTQVHAEVPYRSMSNMRNRMAHGYFDINLEVVWDRNCYRRCSNNYPPCARTPTMRNVTTKDWNHD